MRRVLHQDASCSKCIDLANACSVLELCCVALAPMLNINTISASTTTKEGWTCRDSSTWLGEGTQDGAQQQNKEDLPPNI
mmetsp:Transcript_8014/g.17346  ORF Transcript_8014/g.17346 Transcript_8014/m.17346 type:complete len:80 (-) Transcript_8014:125-364(-)